MAAPAWAGHAGETGSSALLVPELTGLLGLMTILLGAILIVGLVALWLLVRIDRRLRSGQKGPPP